LSSSSNSALAYGALYWKYKTQAFFDYQTEGWPVLGIAYENLVTTPESELKRVVQFLGIQWESELLAHPRFSHLEVFTDGRTVGETDPQRNIDTKSVGQWQRVFSLEETHTIMAVVEDLYPQVCSRR
jgi:hypothetical protein